MLSPSHPLVTVQAKNIPLQKLGTFDESPMYAIKEIKRTQVLVDAAKPDEPTRVQKLHTSRRKFTVATTYTPLTKGPCLVIHKDGECPKQVLKKWENSPKAVVCKYKKSVVDGEFYATVVLPRVLKPMFNEARQRFVAPSSGNKIFLQGTNLCDPPGLFLDDAAGGHSANEFTNTRVAQYRAMNVSHVALASHSTSLRMSNDQIHWAYKARYHKKIVALVGWDANLEDRPAPDQLNLTPMGNRRGPNTDVCTDVAIETWAEFPQLILLGSFVRCGYFTKEQAAQMICMAPEAVLQGMADLEMELAYAKKKFRVDFDHAWRPDVSDVWLRLPQRGVPNPNPDPKRQRIEGPEPNVEPIPQPRVEVEPIVEPIVEPQDVRPNV